MKNPYQWDQNRLRLERAIHALDGATEGIAAAYESGNGLTGIQIQSLLGLISQEFERCVSEWEAIE